MVITSTSDKKETMGGIDSNLVKERIADLKSLLVDIFLLSGELKKLGYDSGNGNFWGHASNSIIKGSESTSSLVKEMEDYVSTMGAGVRQECLMLIDNIETPLRTSYGELKDSFMEAKNMKVYYNPDRAFLDKTSSQVVWMMDPFKSAIETGKGILSKSNLNPSELRYYIEKGFCDVLTEQDIDDVLSTLYQNKKKRASDIRGILKSLVGKVKNLMLGLVEANNKLSEFNNSLIAIEK